MFVPGALITNALLELTAADIVTGSSRLMQGIIMLGFMAAGIAAGSALTGLHVDPSSAALVGEVAGVGTDRGGWEAVPPYWVSWVAVVILAVGLGLVFQSGWRLTLVSVIVMTSAYGLLTGITPLGGSVVATGATAALLFIATRVLERIVPAIPANVSFFPAFLLLVPGTVGLVAVATFDPVALATPLATFVSLCVGTKIGGCCPVCSGGTRRTAARSDPAARRAWVGPVRALHPPAGRRGAGPHRASRPTRGASAPGATRRRGPTPSGFDEAAGGLVLGSGRLGEVVHLLARRVVGEFGDEAVAPRSLVAGEAGVRPGPLLEGSGSRDVVLRQPVRGTDDVRRDDLAPLLVGDADHDRVGDAGCSCSAASTCTGGRSRRRR